MANCFNINEKMWHLEVWKQRQIMSKVWHEFKLNELLNSFFNISVVFSVLFGTLSSAQAKLFYFLRAKLRTNNAIKWMNLYLWILSFLAIPIPISYGHFHKVLYVDSQLFFTAKSNFNRALARIGVGYLCQVSGMQSHFMLHPCWRTNSCLVNQHIFS